MQIERTNLYRGLRMGLCFGVAGILVAVVLLCGGCRQSSASIKAAGDTPFQPRRVEATPEVLRPRAPQARPTPQEQAMELIREYEKKVELEPGSPDAAATLMAIGNLYRQKLMNYREATFHYRQVITNYPDSPQLSLAYMQLADCYEKLDDWRAAQLVYREIVERFPSESSEFLYAQQKQNE